LPGQFENEKRKIKESTLRQRQKKKQTNDSNTLLASTLIELAGCQGNLKMENETLKASTLKQRQKKNERTIAESLCF